jgi:hypothetical protein
VPAHNQRWSQSAVRSVAGRAPLAALPYAGNAQQPSVQVKPSVKSEDQPPAESATAEPKSTVDSSPAIARGNQTAADSVTHEEEA